MMGRIRTRIREDGNRLYDLADERSAIENLMNQRLGLFLVVFTIIIVGVVTTQKKIYFLSILFIGAVICWVLAYTIIRLAKKIGILAKEINSYAGSTSSKIDHGGGKTTRILLGYFVPIFCSTLLVLIFLVGSSGFIDSYLWIDSSTVVKVENKVNEVKNDIKEQITPKKENSSTQFQSVDKVIADSKVTSSKNNDDKLVREVTRQVIPKSIDRSGNFKSIDSLVTPSRTSRSGQSNSRSNPSIPQQSQTGTASDSKNFKSIQSVIVEDQTSKTIQKDSRKSTMPETLKTKKKNTSQAPPMEGFKDIESVIKK
jgi:hypothetical protein